MTPGDGDTPAAPATAAPPTPEPGVPTEPGPAGPERSPTKAAPVPPRQAEGVELIGQSAGSGFKEPPALARRADGQVIQLTPLLYMVVEECDGERDEAEIAAAVSERFGRSVSADNVRTLIEDKLRPLGVLAAADGSSPDIPKPDPLLALRFRKAIIPERASMRVASLFKPLFFPPVVLAALAGLAVFDAWLFLSHGVAQAFRQSAENPALMVPVLAMIVLAAGWHEFGHAAGCAYGGARPGAMGAGIYFVYPAFYTDVTDSYRLGRGGRLRTDLAGVYFNGLFILAVAGLYALTGWEALILIIVVSHIDAARQLLPFLRLDGYYIVADLTGVPDLFSRLKPILLSSLPWRKPDPKVAELKLWARAVVTVWVLVVVPLLFGQLLLLLLHAPRIVATAWTSLGDTADATGVALDDSDVAGVISGVLQSILLVLPVIGIALTFVRLGGRGARKLWSLTEGKPAGRLAAGVAMAAAMAGLAFTWWPDGDYQPIRPGERGTLGEGVAAIAAVPSGRPSLISQERAAESGRLGTDSKPAATTTTTVAGSATTSPGPVSPPSSAPSSTTTVSSTSTTTRPSTSTTRATTTTLAGG